MMLTRRAWLTRAAGGIAAAPFSWIPVSRGWGQEGSTVGGESSGQVATGRRGVAATVHPLATEAAIETMRRGGNAADAAVAAGLMLGVVDGHNSGLGGGCFVLARSADGRVLAIDGRETAPAAATPRMYFRDGEPAPMLSRTGPLASGVPGAVAAYHRLSTELGTGRWSEACRAAAEVAEEGFPLPSGYASRLASVAEDVRRFEASRQVFLHDDGAPLAAGERLVQPDLAGTLREIAGGPDAFYRGRFAEAAGRWMRANGGILTADDFGRYRAVTRRPVESEFRGNRVIGFPPPSSGGVHVAQILGMLERFDLASIAAESPVTYYHLVAESMRRAFADRAKWLGDPDFAKVPLGLVDSDYLRERGASIRIDAATPGVEAGTPPGAETRVFGGAERHTTHFTAADGEGNWVAITATVNTTLGSKVVIPGTGVVMNNEMDDFAIAPGVPNAFGLLGTEANAPDAGKRPLSSMSPTIVTRDGEPVLSCGAAGGPRIISAAAQIVLDVLALQRGLPEAMAAGRVHHQWRPDEVRIESRLGESVQTGLTELGHTVRRGGSIGTAQGIARDADGVLTAASEPRVDDSRAGAF